MPWTKENPPGPAKNWDAEAVGKCVSAANAVKADGGSDQDAIFACIRAAGKTKHPGGKGSLGIEIPDGLDGDSLNKLMESVQEMGLGFVVFAGEPERFEVEYEDGRMMALGSVPSDVNFAQVRALYFRNAILAREETNLNKDHLPAKEIQALAKSIGGMPIDDEHRFEDVVGVFTKGSVITAATGLAAVSVDGLIWPQRFPEIAQEMVEGKRLLSMEVWIAAATCGLCNETFQHSDDYCAHLEHKEAQRTLHGVQGFGGALTIKPAGSDTAFDHDSMMVVASHRVTSKADTTKGANDMELEEKIAQLEQELADAKVQLATQAAELETANTALATATTDLQTAKEATDALRWSIRAQKLTEAGYDEEKLEADKEVLAALPDEAFDILVAALTPDPEDPPADSPVGGSVNLGGGGTNDDDEVILLLK